MKAELEFNPFDLRLMSFGHIWHCCYTSCLEENNIHSPVYQVVYKIASDGEMYTQNITSMAFNFYYLWDLERPTLLKTEVRKGWWYWLLIYLRREHDVLLALLKINLTGSCTSGINQNDKVLLAAVILSCISSFSVLSGLEIVHLGALKINWQLKRFQLKYKLNVHSNLCIFLWCWVSGHEASFIGLKGLHS